MIPYACRRLNRCIYKTFNFLLLIPEVLGGVWLQDSSLCPFPPLTLVRRCRFCRCFLQSALGIICHSWHGKVPSILCSVNVWKNYMCTWRFSVGMRHESPKMVIRRYLWGLAGHLSPADRGRDRWTNAREKRERRQRKGQTNTQSFCSLLLQPARFAGEMRLPWRSGGKAAIGAEHGRPASAHHG